ncbi:MAG: hypothetical protein QF734_03375 [Arenicellales bacterium]|nr:hypothetical protein [Arenicellales bacterium]MDP6313519.1 hypothetical protein [Arenicellales bacterium]MDP7120175.1 hypothetical protein [Arenicellales bacterium]MDP7192316.1 hypothetical protein [Arenicellales bacterium]MDP7489233.1 hypothetical protein [Arenicellales bacterium]
MELSSNISLSLVVDWQSSGVGHRERHHFERVNLWRDIVPWQATTGAIGAP